MLPQVLFWVSSSFSRSCCRWHQTLLEMHFKHHLLPPNDLEIVAPVFKINYCCLSLISIFHCKSSLLVCISFYYLAPSFVKCISSIYTYSFLVLLCFFTSFFTSFIVAHKLFLFPTGISLEKQMCFSCLALCILDSEKRGKRNYKD